MRAHRVFGTHYSRVQGLDESDIFWLTLTCINGLIEFLTYVFLDSRGRARQASPHHFLFLCKDRIAAMRSFDPIAFFETYPDEYCFSVVTHHFDGQLSSLAIHG